MRTGFRLAAAFALCAAAAAIRPVRAQGSAGTSVSFIAGGGGVISVTQPGFDRSTGSAYFAGLEFAQPWRAGFAGGLALRVEGGFAQQPLSTNGAASGNVQTVHAAALLTWTVPTHASLHPFVLAGPVWARPSTRIAVDAIGDPTPGAQFAETTHDSALGAQFGVGTGWHLGAATMRLDVRWTLLATSVKSTSMIPIGISIVLPLHS